MSASRALAFAGIFSISFMGCGGGTSVSVPPASGSGSTATAPASGPTAAPTASSGGGSTGGTGTTPSVEPTIPFPAATDSDPFYAQPKPFPAVAPGTILGSRKVTYSPGGVAQPNDAYQLRFASTDEYGFPIAAIATYVKPLVPSTGKEPLLVNAFAEDSLAARCAPSHDMTTTTPGDAELDELPVAQAGLEAGWTVDYPDHEGPYSEYVVGQVEGHVSLDSIRAAEQFAPLGLNAQTPVGLNGYSGGAEAVSWATSLHKSYAPELNIVGTASGGTPADIIGILESIDATSALSVVANEAFFDIIFMSTVGINRGYPTFLTPLLNAKGVAAAEDMANGCGGDNSDGSSGPTGHFTDYLTTSNPEANPVFIAGAQQVTMPIPGKVPTTNMLVYQSITDELIPVAGVDALVKSWCASGSPINYYRATTGDHVSTEPANTEWVILYLTAKFGGTTPTLPPTTTSCNGAGGA